MTRGVRPGRAASARRRRSRRGGGRGPRLSVPRAASRSWCQPRVVTDEEAIRDVIARYNLYGDSGRVDEMLELFVDDATLTVDGTAYVGRPAIRGLFEAAVGPTPQRIRHHTSTHVIDVDGDRAAARCYFQVLTSEGLDHWGRYRDELVRSDGYWAFARREVRVDGMTPGGWAAQRGHDAPETGVGGGALSSRSRTTAPSSLGDHRAPLSTRGPCCHPSATLTTPPSTSNTRPVTSRDSVEPSQTTSGETLSGAIASNPLSGAFIMSGIATSVIRVRAAGAMALTVTP